MTQQQPNELLEFVTGSSSWHHGILHGRHGPWSLSRRRLRQSITLRNNYGTNMGLRCLVQRREDPKDQMTMHHEDASWRHHTNTTNTTNTSEFGRNSTIFGRTDLRKGVSEAKFDVEAAGDVKNSKISRKSAENHEKPKNFAKKVSKNFYFDFFFDSESFETRFGNVLQVKNCETNCEKIAKKWICLVEYGSYIFEVTLTLNVCYDTRSLLPLLGNVWASPGFLDCTTYPTLARSASPYFLKKKKNMFFQFVPLFEVTLCTEWI